MRYVAQACLVALSVCSVEAAFAADMPVKAAPVALYSWSGCYAGGNVGWVGSRDAIDRYPSGTYSAAALTPSPPNAAGGGLLAGDIALTSHSDTVNSSGITGGVQLGCNRQSGNFVFGLEGDINWTSLKSSINASYPQVVSVNPAFAIAAGNENVTNNLEWYSTIRGRVGFARDRLLLFATGGLAIGQFKSDTAVVFSPTLTGALFPVLLGAQHIGSSSQTRVGYAIGAGLEYAMDQRWSFKAEYLYLDFGSWIYNSPLVAPAGVAPGYSWSTRISAREHMVRIGANYRFQSQLGN